MPRAARTTVSAPPRVTPVGGWHAALLDEAADLTRREGWQAVTMGRLARAVGVSRQTVYNELGSKSELAEAMVFRELERFLAEVDAAFEQHPDDLVAAIRSAAYAVLEMAAVNPLLHAILSTTQGAESELLPLLTTNSEVLLGTAGEMIREHVARYDTGLPEHRLETLIDMVVRLVVSHVMQPGGDPSEISETVSWIAARVLG